MAEKTISGYTTTYNCFEMEYPFQECLQSLLGFCDDVVVVDAGSTDGTLEVLRRFEKQDSRLKVFVEPVDFKHPRWAIYQDGYLKAKARARCQGDFCWQTDTDEVVAPEDFWRIRQLPSRMKDLKLIMLPMIEFWGSLDYVRGDFFSWKPRFSVNDKRITHGIPKALKCFDANGHEYPRPFDSDSCNYIYADTQESVKIVVPLPPDQNDISKLTDSQFEQFYFRCLDDYPHVFHTSWLDLRRKVSHYKKLWRDFHASMYNLDLVDSAANNVMFDKPWAAVTDADIQRKADELKRLGPRFFHKKMDTQKKGLTFRFNRKIPDHLRRWVESHPSSAQKNATDVKELSLSLWSAPLVTAVIPAHNQAGQLADTVASLSAQHYKELEIVVVNDGSTDNLGSTVSALVAQYPTRKIRLLEKTRGGRADAKNYGMQAALGDYVLTLNPGERATPDYVLRGIDEMQKSRIAVFGPHLGEDFNPFFLRYRNLISPGSLFERELWDKTGGFRPVPDAAADWDFWINASRREPKVLVVKEQLLLASGWSAGSEKDLLPFVSVLNHDLYPVDEVILNHGKCAFLPPALLAEVAQLARVHTHDWAPRFFLGCIAEHCGKTDEAMSHYAESISLSAEKNWQPIYRLGLLVQRLGKEREAAEFFHCCRLLRPDLGRLLNEFLHRFEVLRMGK